MTMIVGVIAKTGIVLASDTRGMVGDPGNFLGYHDHARKIAVSSPTVRSQIACAIACNASNDLGESVVESAQSILSNHQYRKDTSLHLVHCVFEDKYKNLNLRYQTRFSLTSIFAKFEGVCPSLSYGCLSNNIEIKTHSGVLSYPQIRDDTFGNAVATKDQAIQFAKDKISERATRDGIIGSTMDIVYVSLDKTEWVQESSRPALSAMKMALYEEYKRNPSVITLLKEKHLLEEWFKK